MQYFIALDFEKPIREKFHSVARTLKVHAEKARIVEAEHMHLTLSFLGELDEGEVEKIKRIIKAIEAPSFDLAFTHVSHFTPQRGGRIAWVGPEEKPALFNLHSQLRRSLEDFGFKVEERPFTPHVTLARGVRMDEGETLGFKETFEPFKAKARTVSFICSYFEQGVLKYKLVATRELNTQ